MLFRNKNKNLTERVKNVTRNHDFISHVRALFKKTEYEIFTRKMD